MTDRTGFLSLAWQWLIRPPTNVPVITFVDRFNIFICRVVMFLTAIIVTVIVIEVTSRYVFRSPTLWANELSVWLAAMIYLVAGIYAMQRRGHIRVTAIYDLVPRNVQRVFDFISMVVVVVYVFAMVIAAWDIALETVLRWERLGTAWNPPVPATIKPLVLIASILVAVQAVNNFIVDSRQDRDVRSDGNVD